MKRILIISVFAMIGLAGCSDKHSEPNIEPVQNMMKAPSMKAQGEDLDAPDKRGMRLPPEGTVPQGWEPYAVDDFDVANNTVKNPVPASKEVLAHGQKLYLTYCSVCHGTLGAGDGPVAPKMLLTPPSLTSEKIVGWNDGGIYHLITRGRGLMGSYESQVPKPNDRWAIVHYVRHLQQNNKK